MKSKFLFLTLLIPFLSVAQTEIQKASPKRNTIYVEAFGQGIYNSFAFDRLLCIGKKVKTSFSAGVTLIPSPELLVLAAPVSYNFLFGKKNHHLELGIGVTVMYLREMNIQSSSSYIDDKGVQQRETFVGHANNFYSYCTPKIGYRFQKENGGIFFRATLTPLLAGINREGATKGGSSPGLDWSRTEYFTGPAFFGERKIMPWAGLSIGWTLRK